MKINTEKINNYHKQAMDLALEASMEEKQGNSAIATDLYKQAYVLEHKAALELKHFDQEPTRSILFRSAASLAKKCGLIEEARELVNLGLEGNPPINVKEQLKELEEGLNDKAMTYAELKEQINQGNFAEVFEFLGDLYEEFPDDDKSIFKTIRKEYITGVDKNDAHFISRLKVFVSSVKMY